MPIMNKREWKIFFSLLLIYAIFAGFSGWNESSLLSYTLALGLDSKLTIDEYNNNSLFYNFDKYQNDGHIYSDKPPGLPIVGAFFVKMIKVLFGDNIDKISWKLFTTIWIIIIFTSGIAITSTAILLYRFSRKITKNEKLNLLLCFTYGLGTSTLLYATKYRTHALPTFLFFLSFYIIYTKKDKLNLKQYFLVGLCCGWAGITDLTILGLIIALAILANSYLNQKSNRGKKILSFCLGLLLPILVYLLINYLTYNSINTISYFNQDLNYWPNNRISGLSSILTIIKMILLEGDFYSLIQLKDTIYLMTRNIIHLLFLPFRGLFFYSPILVLSLFGVRSLYKNNRKVAILLLSISLLLLFFTAGLQSWWCHGGGSCRRFLPLIPFLFIPIMYAAKRINYRALIILSIISILFNLLTIQAYDSLGGYPYGILETTYRYTIIQFFDYIANPLFGHYLPLFLVFGPKSNLIERIIGFGLPPFINLLFIAFALSMIWFKELKRFFKIHRKKCLTILVIILSVISMRIIFHEPIEKFAKEQYINYYIDKPIEDNIRTNERLSFLYPNYFYDKYKDRIIFNIPYIIRLSPDLVSLNKQNKNWYIPQVFPATPHNRTFMYDNATITLFLNSTRPKIFNLSLAGLSVNKKRALNIYVNDESLNQYEITSQRRYEINEAVLLHPGVNQLRFESSNGCEYVYKFRGGSDTNMQCMSFIFYEIKIV